MATGTIVTNGALKGGDRPIGGVVHSDNNSSNVAAHSTGGISESQSSSSKFHLTDIKNDWHNAGDDIVTFTLAVPHLEPVDVDLKFYPRKFQISFKTRDEKFHMKHGTESDTKFIWERSLSGEVVPENCTYCLTEKSVVINLAKKTNEEWDNPLDICQPISETGASTDDLLHSVGDTRNHNSSPGEDDKDDDDDLYEPVQTTKFRHNNYLNNFIKPIKPIWILPGFTGLDNLGNTCFMNSVLQVLANTTGLREYFLDRHFKNDINVENPLGMKGKMAEEFSCVIKKLWSSVSTSHAPVRFRRCVGEKGVRFTDYLQHDAQEFMAFLLDQLHEDVNRIKVKPYYQISEQERDDHALAEESWKLHKSRNDSYIVDLFHGLFKSQLECPECEKNSVKFDPFLFLPVPLPSATYQLEVLFHCKDPEKNLVKITVTVNKSDCTVLDVLSQVSAQTNCSIKQLRMFKIFRSRIRRFYDPESFLDEVFSNEILFIQEVLSEELIKESVYEVAVIQHRMHPETKKHCSHCHNAPNNSKLLKRCMHCMTVAYCNQQCQKLDWPQHRKVCQRIPERIGLPFIASIPYSCTSYDEIKAILIKHARHSVEIDYHPNEEESDETITPTNRLNFDIRSTDNTRSIRDETPLVDYERGIVNLINYETIAIYWHTEPKLVTFVEVYTKQVRYDIARPPPRAPPNLYDCIKLFTKPEVLAPGEAWYCPSCKEHREATKQMSIWQLPEMLVIQLKRFSFKYHMWRDKLDMFIDFPVRELDMSEHCVMKSDDNSQLYDLFGVINHYGGGIHAGHYTSFVRLPDPEDSRKSNVDWRVCDDGHVTKLSSEEEVVTKAAYVLLYKRRKAGVASERIVSLTNGIADKGTEEKQYDADESCPPLHNLSNNVGLASYVNHMGDAHDYVIQQHMIESSGESDSSSDFFCKLKPIGWDSSDDERSDTSGLLNVSPVNTPDADESPDFAGVTALSINYDFEMPLRKYDEDVFFAFDDSRNDDEVKLEAESHLTEQEGSLNTETCQATMQVSSEGNRSSPLDYTDMDEVD